MVFKLSAPRPPDFIMGAIASGWNGIVRKKTLEDNQYNLRRVVDIPGTGPFKSKRRVENEVWVMEKNPTYWNKGLPYLDGIEFYHALPFSPELGSALLSGRVDYARLLDPGSLRKVKATQGMSGTDFYQSVIQATWMNNKKKPMDDPRVRRAFHLVLDKPVLVDVVKDIAPMMVGGFIYPFSELRHAIARAQQAAGLPGRPDRLDQGSQGADEGGGLREGHPGPRLPGARGRRASSCGRRPSRPCCSRRSTCRPTSAPPWNRCGSTTCDTGKFDLAIGAIVSTLLDPSDYFNAWYKKGGPQNYSQWDNPKFNALLPQIDSEVDPKKRLELIRQAEMIMEEDPPLLPMSWEKINDGWYNYVKGHRPNDYFGIYDVVRFDTFWLDK